MGAFGASTVTSITSSTAATTDTELVRLGELNTALALKAASNHTHTSSGVEGLLGFITSSINDLTEDSDSVQWDDTLTPSVKLRADSALSIDASGLGVVLGTGVNEAAYGNHVHADSHTILTSSDTGTITHTLNGQVLSSAVQCVASGGIVATDTGIQCDTNIERVGHTHALLHNPLTVSNTTSITHTLSTQQLSSAVVLSPSAASGFGRLTALADGLAVVLGSSGVNAAAGDHTHSNATTLSAGFMSAADKQSLQNYQSLLQVEQNVPFFRHDYLLVNQYIGGSARWGQDMQLMSADLTCYAPTVTGIMLALEKDSVVFYTGMEIPSGAQNTEVSQTFNFSNLFIEAGDYLRVLCNSGVETTATAPSLLSFNLIARPALGNVPEFRFNCGGTVQGTFADDDYFDSGASRTTAESISLTGVTNPAPVAVYQSERYYSSSTPQTLTYYIPNLGLGITYNVRLHFADHTWASANDQKMDISVTGDSTLTESAYDIIAVAGTNQAAVLEFPMLADANGVIQVIITPLLANNALYNYGICGIEIIQA